MTNEELRLRRADGTTLWGLVHLREVGDRPSTYLEGIIIIEEVLHEGPRDPGPQG